MPIRDNQRLAFKINNTIFFFLGGGGGVGKVIFVVAEELGLGTRPCKCSNERSMLP